MGAYALKCDTLEQFLGVSFLTKKSMYDYEVDLRNDVERAKRLRAVETLLIDDVTYYSKREIQILDTVMRKVNEGVGGHNHAFGGIQLIVAGDFLGLVAEPFAFSDAGCWFKKFAVNGVFSVTHRLSTSVSRHPPLSSRMWQPNASRSIRTKTASPLSFSTR